MATHVAAAGGLQPSALRGLTLLYSLLHISIKRLALAEQHFSFTELADDLFGGIALSRHLTSNPCLILTLQLDKFLGAGHNCERLSAFGC